MNLIKYLKILKLELEFDKLKKQRKNIRKMKQTLYEALQYDEECTIYSPDYTYNLSVKIKDLTKKTNNKRLVLKKTAESLLTQELKKGK